MSKRRISGMLALAMLGLQLMSISGIAAGAAVSSFSRSGGTYEEVIEANASGGYDFTFGNAVLYAKLGEKEKNNAELYWTDADFENANGASAASVPCIDSSVNNWSGSPCFTISFSSSGYENIEFSAKLGGTKKAPRDFKLQYSYDGIVFNDVSGTETSISANKSMEQLFAQVPVPVADRSTAYIRIINTSNKTVENKTISPASGSLAINDIEITGTKKASEQTKPSAPTVNFPSGSALKSDDKIVLTSPEGADIRYSLNGGAEQLYTQPFTVVSAEAVSVSLVAWAQSGTEISDKLTASYTYAGDNISVFSFNKLPETIRGYVLPSSGTYRNSKLTASANAADMFVPLFDLEEQQMGIAPDDGITWEKGGGWQLEVCTAGYRDIKFSADAYSSKNGPASMSLKYSVDGVNYTSLVSNKTLPVSTIGNYYNEFIMPEELADKEKVYIKLEIEENARTANATNETPLFGSEGKGNTYINNIVISGYPTGTLKMPYTLKNNAKFASGKAISYVSPDGAAMKYDIYDANGSKVVSAADYTESGIVPGLLDCFDEKLSYTFTVNIWAEYEKVVSPVNSSVYSFKGKTLCGFTLEDNLSDGSVKLSASEGAGTLSMRPNAKDDTAFIYKKNTIYAAADDANYWTFDKTRTDSSADGYWLIETSTKGYKEISITAEQLSTGKGPRDWCLAVSTDGTSFTEVPDSAVRVSETLCESYNNFELPESVADKEKVYIKIKINGGEGVNSRELDEADDPNDLMLGKGNTGLNNVKICGVEKSDSVRFDGVFETLSKGERFDIISDSVSGEAQVVAAFYDVNGFNSADLFNTSGRHTVTVPEGATSVKLMLWKDFISCKPIAAPVSKAVK